MARQISPPTSILLQTSAAQERIAAKAHADRAVPLCLKHLQEYDALEHHSLAGRAVKVWTGSLATGFCLAIFPATPGLVGNCQPDHNVGWECGARIAAFVAGCGAALVGVQAGLSLWRERRYLDQEAARLALDVGRVASGQQGHDWPVDLFQSYRQGDPASRERLRRFLSTPPDGVLV